MDKLLGALEGILFVVGDEGINLSALCSIMSINETEAKVMYICNAMTQPGETDGFGVSDHVDTIEKYIGKKKYY